MGLGLSARGSVGKSQSIERQANTLLVWSFHGFFSNKKNIVL